MAESWLFRVASRPEFGGGHVKRCLVLAAAMGPSTSVRFLLDSGGEAWAPTVTKAGHAVSLDGDWPRSSIDGVVLDHHDTEAADVEPWRSIARRVVAFRDGGRPVPGADIEICQWESRGRDPEGRLLRGLDYAIVDRSYIAISKTPIKDLPERVLVAFGYRDSPDATAHVLEALDRLGAQWNPTVTVALGANAPNLKHVEAACDRLGTRAMLVVDSVGLQNLISDCDFAVGAGGVSAVERAAAGRPSLTIALNALQVPASRALAQAGATADCGLLASLSAEKLDTALMSLARDRSARASMARSGRRVVDGRGAERVAQRLLQQAAVGG